MDDSRYYYQLLKYIADNPLKAGLVKNVNEYTWSAHKAVKARNNEIVDTDRTLAYFPTPQSKAVADYIQLVECNGTVTSEYGLAPVKDQHKCSDGFDILLRSMNIPEGVAVRIKQGDRRRDIKNERDRFIQKAYTAGFNITQIAEYVSFSYEGIRKAVKGMER